MRDQAIDSPDSDLMEPIYSRCPTSLTISSVLINPKARKQSNLIRLAHRDYKSLFDRIYNVRGFTCPVYVILKFAEIYLEGDITLGDVTQIVKDIGSDPIPFIVKFATHDIIKQRYHRYHRDNRLEENDREIAIQALELFQTFFDPPH